MASTTELQEEVKRLRVKVASLEKALVARGAMPELAPADADGYRPAGDTVSVLLARQIITMRLAAGLTQAQLAALAGVRVETISRLETGKNSPNVRTVEKIERALAVATEPTGKRKSGKRRARP